MAKYYCWDCDGRFTSTEALQSHCSAKKHIQAIECPHCDLLVETAKELSQHTKAKHMNKCNVCRTDFNSIDALVAHNRAKHDIYCSVCKLGFQNPKHFEDHNKARHQKACEFCLAFCSSDKELQAHVAEKHTFPCKECKNRIFKSKDALNSHQNSDAHPLKCTFCHARFKTDDGRTEHYSTAHFRCDKCPLIFGTWALRGEHILDKHTFSCPWCDKKFDSEKGLKTHKTESHRYACKTCQKVLPSKEDLQSHIVKRHSLECSECNLKFKSTDELSSHNFASHVTRCEVCSVPLAINDKKSKRHEFSCVKCNKCFPSIEARDKHKSEEHAFTCVKCGQDFKTIVKLDEHKTVAHGFRCTSCAKLFESESALADHHKNAHQLSCPKCEDKFDGPDKLIQHFKLDHILRCGSCEATYENTANLEARKTTHHNALKCGICPDILFLTQDALEAHVSAAHEKQQTLICDHCKDIIFLSETALNQHTTSLHDRRFNCCLCDDLSFLTQETFDEHLTSMHEKKPLLTCDFCIGTVFLSEGAKALHSVVIHGDTSTVACALCSELAYPPASSSPSNDLHTIHEEAETNPNAEADFEPKQETWECHYCPNNPDHPYLTQLSLLEHVITNHPEKLHQWCEQCPETYFTTIPAYEYHLRTYHPWPKEDEDNTINKTLPAKVTFTCPYCPSYQCTTPGDLTIHLSDSHGYKCPFCFTKFENNYQLVQHIDAMHLLKCSFHECLGTGFKGEDALKRHLARFHTRFETVVVGENGGAGGGGSTSSEDVGASPSVSDEVDVGEEGDVLLG
ncbi:hypothetical protein ONS96_008647 [Cadophora gregata f. sp. sojae]|nr:hypothetical protein ONS96_008647 [Cadophora gregata f. sp. sojae]